MAHPIPGSDGEQETHPERTLDAPWGLAEDESVERRLAPGVQIDAFDVRELDRWPSAARFAKVLDRPPEGDHLGILVRLSRSGVISPGQQLDEEGAAFLLAPQDGRRFLAGEPQVTQCRPMLAQQLQKRILAPRADSIDAHGNDRGRHFSRFEPSLAPQVKSAAIGLRLFRSPCERAGAGARQDPGRGHTTGAGGSSLQFWLTPVGVKAVKCAHRDRQPCGRSWSGPW